MEKARAAGRGGSTGAARREKSERATRGRGRGGGSARGGRGRGRGRGRGGRGGETKRVVFAWKDHESEEAPVRAKMVDHEVEEMTDSDYERLDAEIDGVVEIAELETFAGTMVVDADDIELKRERTAEVKEAGKKKKEAAKKKKNEKKNKSDAEVRAEVADGEKAEQSSGDTETEQAKPSQEKKKSKKSKKSRVSVVVTADTVLEVVTLENDVGQTEHGATVQISVKDNTKKKKKKEKKEKKSTAAEREEAVYESVEIHEVIERVDEALCQEKSERKSVHTKKSKKEKRVMIEVSEAPDLRQTMKTKYGGRSDTKLLVSAQTSDETSEVVNGGSKSEGGTKLQGRREKQGSKAWNAHHGSKVNDRENAYEDYEGLDAVMQALERGELYQGKLRVNPQYRMRAFLTVEGIPVDILVDGMKDRNRAMDGDLVVIKIHPEEQWKLLKEPSKDDTDEETKKLSVEKYGPVPTGDEDVTRKSALNALWRPTLDASRCFLPSHTSSTPHSVHDKSLTTAKTLFERSQALKARPTAKVVHVMASGNAQGFVGSLEPKSKVTDPEAQLPSDDDYAYFNAEDSRIPRRIRIPRLQLPDQFISRPLKYSKEMLCFCRITKWSVRHEAPMGEFVKTLGEYSGIESGISAILMKHGLMQHTLDFRREILEELDTKYGAGGEKWAIPPDELLRRRDFRKYQIFSIDPYNARDLDDALHIRALNKEETEFEVGVHIADVTHFIDKGSFLDVEAQQRATSVYLANRVLPMLPRVLCERLCSLQPQVDRLAFSVVWKMKSDGSLVEGCEPWFGKSIIRSCCKLDYGTAQRMLDGEVTKDKLDDWEMDRRPIDGDNPDITPVSVIQAVKYLWKVAKNRRATRFDTGAVTLQNIKLTFTLDEKGNPTSFGTYQLKNSNRLVEEYMLLANYLVAQRLLQAHGPLAFIRRHPEPTETALVTTLGILSENSINVDGSSPKNLTDSLDNVLGSMGNYVYSVVQNMITKPMKPAEYLVAGNAGHEAAWRHYALNIPYYTHFTSPIRRYADVVVHRLLQESIVDAENVANRVAAANDELTQLMHELSSVAQNCNEKKMTSKNAEKECDLVFLCAYVKYNGAVDVTGVVVSTGSRSFTVYIHELGLEQRIEVNTLKTVGWSWQEKISTLSLIFNSTKKKRGKSKEKTEPADGAHGVTEAPKLETDATGNRETVQSERVELKFLTKLRMRMTTTDRMPLALKYEVVGPWKE